MRQPPAVPVTSDGPVPDGLVDAVLGYERALMADDVAALDAAFEPGGDTWRADAGGVLDGHDAIAGFRRGRGGAPARVLEAIRVRVLGADAALVLATVLPAAGGHGTQTQLWRRTSGVWRVGAAVVVMPAPAIDGRVWRVVGTPLVPAEGAGPLAGARVAVKDLFAVAEQRVGGGVPAWLAEARSEQASASAVRALTAAGAEIVGIARTDEFAYSIAGANPHYGTPPNAAVPGALPGGSTSGPATAVAAGQADIGLGTDTGGSIRVPASYQGLWGLRTTHGAVAIDGVLPLAPSFDTVGWLTRDLALLRRVADVCLPAQAPAAPGARLALVPATLERLAPAVRDAFLDAAGSLGSLREVHVGDLDAVHAAFRTLQTFEAWRVHGRWLEGHPGALRGAVAERFEAARATTRQDADAADAVVAAARTTIRSVLAEAVLVVPSAASAAPQATADPAELDRVRADTLRITCIAGAAGAPALSMPLASVGGAPLGVCLIGAPGSDRALLALAAESTGRS